MGVGHLHVQPGPELLDGLRTEEPLGRGVGGGSGLDWWGDVWWGI